MQLLTSKHDKDFEEMKNRFAALKVMCYCVKPFST